MAKQNRSRFTTCKVVLVRIGDGESGTSSIVLGAGDPDVFKAMEAYVTDRRARMGACETTKRSGQ